MEFFSIWKGRTRQTQTGVPEDCRSGRPWVGAVGWAVLLLGLLYPGLVATALPAEQHVVPIDDSWTKISFDRSYEDPVVFVGPPTYHGEDPGVVRVRHVGGGDVEARFQEWNYQQRQGDYHHRTEIVPVLVIEKGRYAEVGGAAGPEVWEVGTFNLEGTVHGEKKNDGKQNWTEVRFSGDFEGRPLLFLTVQTAIGGHAITARATEVTASSFKVALFEEENLNRAHPHEEEVGYLAIWPGHQANTGTVTLEGGSTSYRIGRLRMDHQWKTWAEVDLKLEEEKSFTGETTHRNEERVDLLELDGEIYAQDVTTAGLDTVAFRARYPWQRGPKTLGTLTLDSIDVDAADDNNGDDGAFLAMEFEVLADHFVSVKEVNWVKDLFVNKSSGYTYTFNRSGAPDGVILDEPVAPYAVFGSCVAFFESDNHSPWADVKRAFSATVDEARKELKDKLSPTVRRQTKGVDPAVREKVVEDGIRVAESVADSFDKNLADRKSAWRVGLKDADDYFGSVCFYSVNAPSLRWEEIEDMVSDSEHLYRPGSYEEIIGFDEGLIDPPAPLIHNNQWTIHFSVNQEQQAYNP